MNIQVNVFLNWAIYVKKNEKEFGFLVIDRRPNAKCSICILGEGSEQTS